MSESNGGGHEDPPTAPPSEGGTAQNTPGVEVIDDHATAYLRDRGRPTGGVRRAERGHKVGR